MCQVEGIWTGTEPTCGKGGEGGREKRVCQVEGIWTGTEPMCGEGRGGEGEEGVSGGRDLDRNRAHVW